MALEFKLSLQSDLNAEEIIELIAENSDFKKSVSSKEDGDFYGQGFICWVSPLDEIGREILFEEHQINADLNLRFWHNSADYDAGLLNILKVVYFVLKNTTGDAVFENTDGYVIISKIGQKFSFNSESFSKDDESIWKLKDIPFKNYELETLN